MIDLQTSPNRQSILLSNKKFERNPIASRKSYEGITMDCNLLASLNASVGIDVREVGRETFRRLEQLENAD